ncbi:MAG: hypothetical protein LAT64_01030 [Phycisphaerales bacterium]|nr:hypothetical protein [Planctomycetota bacterium]MCH8507345.1 hypothetical protein [Phycisphaerales bacterium]
MLTRSCSVAFLCAAGAMAMTASASQFDLIGVNFTTAASTTPDPQNWTRISTPDGAFNNLQNENGNTTDVGVSWGGGASGGFVFLGTSTLAADATPQYDYDLSGMTGYGFRSNGEFFLSFDGLQANALYEFWFVAYRGGTTIDNLINVSDGDTIDAFSFTQQITSGDNDGRFLVNSTNANSSMHWNDLSMMTNSSSNGTLTFNWALQTQTPVVGAVAIRLVPSPGTAALLGLTGMVAMRRRR